jgi:hypothetical protein
MTGETRIVLENDHLFLSLDAIGCVTSFVNKRTGTEYLTYPGLADNWKILVLGEGYPVYYILGKEQQPAAVEQEGARVTFRYRGLTRGDTRYNIDLDFTAFLEDEEARFQVSVRNGHTSRIREVWYPILGGFQGFQEAGEQQIVHLAKSRTLARDILHRGLPGAEYLFVVDDETAHYTYPWDQMQWIDLFCETEGLYVSSDDTSFTTTVFRLEKHPPEAGATASPHVPELHLFPPDTPRWLRITVGKLVTIDPGEEWHAPPATFWPHQGDWHAAADHYRAWTRTWMVEPERPSWLSDYVGWQHIVGKTYLGEIYHTFDDFVEVMVEAQKRTGVDVLMLYGHTQIGCEGSDYDLSPAEDLGGEEAFRRMCDELHKRGMKVMVMTHRQSAIAMELPEYKRFEKWAIKDRRGETRKEVWWKTTIESLMANIWGHFEATGPIWARICPYCDEWWESFLEELKKLMALGLDGVQLDTISTEGLFCYATDHGHKPGAGQMDKLVERLAWLRREVRAINPEFMLCGEEIQDWLFQYLDLPYSRYRLNEGYQVFRYTFPETKENVAVAAYSYDQANKSFMLGMGMDIEVWGLKKSVLACPELADYIGDIVKIRRAQPDYLINGRYIDTLRVKVEGNVRYGVHEGPQGLAVVLWNQTDERHTCQVSFDQADLQKGLLYLPGATETEVALPCAVTVEPHRVAAIIAES